jgi:16S rRNA A1518/A1519 N6-dimethyltransferase RsmA/KsgA/DIM1 with predicted DNA glycosylase/AP lyase activity
MFEKSLILKKDYKNFIKLVHAGFSHRRKTLVNSLGGDKKKTVEILKKLSLPVDVRAQKLTIEDWKNLELS